MSISDAPRKLEAVGKVPLAAQLDRPIQLQNESELHYESVVLEPEL